MKVDCFKFGSISTDQCNISRVQIRMNICEIDAFKRFSLKYRLCTINQTNIFCQFIYSASMLLKSFVFIYITTKNFSVAFFSVLLSAIFKAGYFESSIKAIIYQSAQRMVFSYVV